MKNKTLIKELLEVIHNTKTNPNKEHQIENILVILETILEEELNT